MHFFELKSIYEQWILFLIAKMIQINKYNKYMKEIKKHQQQNQFMYTPLSARERLKQKQKYNQELRNKYISDLEDRNKKLFDQISKITQSLQLYQQKESAKKQPHKLVPIESSTDVIKKQLENGYKQIKTYQRQIKILELKQSGGSFHEKLSRFQTIIKQKDGIIQKLKSEISQLHKLSKDHTRKLTDNTGKQQVEIQVLKHNQKIKILKQKIREAEERETQKQLNAKKQYEHIKKIQQELITAGVSTEFLQGLKNKNIYNFMQQKSESNANQKKINKIQGQKEQQIEQLTPERYADIKNDIKIYKKVSIDYSKRLDLLLKTKQEEQLANTVMKSKIIQKQNELVTLENLLKQLKKKVKLQDFLKPSKSVPKESDQNKRRRHQLQYLYHMKRQKSVAKSNSVMNSPLKCDQKGIKTEKGVRFTDRTSLGKNYNTKIVGVKIWIEKNTFFICGIQCFYKSNHQIKSGAENINQQCKDQMVENLMQLTQGDYIKSISGNLNSDNIIEYLVFISAQNKIARFGVSKQNQKQFVFDIHENEIPVCLYGSLRTKNEQNKSISLIQNLGFQICQDFGNYEKQSI